MDAELYNENQELVPAVSIENLLNVRAGAIARYAKIRDLYAEARGMLEAINVRVPRVTMAGSGYRDAGRDADDTHALELVSKEIDAATWGYLMRESGLRTFMDAKARETWDEKIGKHEVPPLTIENIEATFSDLYANRGRMFEDGVINMFKGLAWDYKTNSPVRFGKRIIVTCLAQYAGTSANFRTCDKIDDLMRVFHVLDGKPERDVRRGTYSDISAAWARRERFYENEYIAVKWFKNNNGHITFKREDLVDKLNLIVAKHYPGALPAPKN
jgi:hypothetical protein